jgi:hypothetical protein
MNTRATYWPAGKHDGFQEQFKRNWDLSDNTANISVFHNVMRISLGNGVKYFAKFGDHQEALKALAQINRGLGHP